MTLSYTTRRAALLATLAAAILAGLRPAHAAAPYVPRGTERKAILDALRAPVTKQLGRPVEFVIKHFAVTAGWAFVMADMQGPGGGQINWQSTPCSGDVSHLVGGLLRLQNGQWTVTGFALCPTDVAWATWPKDHGAPAAIFPH